MTGKGSKGAGRAPRGRRTPAGSRAVTRKPGSPAGAGASRPAKSAEPAASVPPGPFRLGAIPGATPGTWIGAWNERMPQNPLELVQLAVADQRAALLSGEVDAALVRLPIDRDELHVIALYDEVPVVVVSADSHLSAADELTAADLAGEVLIVPSDDVLGFTATGSVAPAFAAPDTEESIATVATGVGVVVVPMSLARLHHRKDVEHRPLRDGPTSTVALAWVAERTTPLVDTFVGIVRGRTANSSRG